MKKIGLKKAGEKVFNFDSSKATVKIRLATVYNPKILHNSITKRPYNGIIYVVNGKQTYTFNGGTCSAVAGQALYLPADCEPYEYTVSADNGKKPRTMQVEFEIKDAQTDRSMRFFETPTLLNFSEKSAFEHSLASLIATYMSSLTSAKHECISELYRIFSLCGKLGDVDTDKKAKKNIAPAVKYIEENYNKKITGDELSALCGISQSQLRRDFNTVYGMSPMEYKREIVCKMAKRMINTGDFKIGEIADMLGFGDIYEFSHFFTKETGMSPKEYYKNHN